MIVMPPARLYRRPRTWDTFERLFDPIVREDDTVLRERWDLPADLDPRHVWTVLDCDGRLFLTPGFRFVNRFAYVLCCNAWGGEAHAHPDYRY